MAVGCSKTYVQTAGGSAAMCVQRATYELLDEPVWAINSMLCDKNSFRKYTVLETLSKNCGEYIYAEIERDILQKMVKIGKKKPDLDVREKILTLIDTWHCALKGSGGKHRHYSAAYKKLLTAEVKSPPREENAGPQFTPQTHPIVRGGPSIHEDVTALNIKSAHGTAYALEVKLSALQPHDGEEHYKIELSRGNGTPNAIYGDPKGVPLQQTMFIDTPAPFSCVYCGSSGLTTVRSKPSLAAVVGCMMPFMLGCCFLCPSMDCLWHKYHHCPSCGQKVADFEKSYPCLVMDPPRWTETSFPLPA